MTGAAILAASAAFRADAGYVVVAAPADSLSVIETQLVEAVKRPLEEAVDATKRATALALGPGLGRGPDRKALVRALLATNVPAVVDADALHELEPFERDAPTILTPHSGELGRLIGEESSWVDEHRLEALRRTVEKYGCTVLLKGADTLIGAPGEGVWVVGGAVPQLATAGTGDVLTGIIGRFSRKVWAQAKPPRLPPCSTVAQRGRESAASSRATSSMLCGRDAPLRAHRGSRRAPAERAHAAARARRWRSSGRS